MRLTRLALIVGIVLLALVFGAGWLVFHSQAFTRALDQADTDTPLASYRETIDAAKHTSFTAHRSPEERAQANKVLVAALANPLFARLGKLEQAGVYAGAGWAAMRLDDNVRARDMLVLAVKLEPDDSDNWGLLAETQGDLDDYDAAAKTLSIFAKRWPDRLDDEKDFIVEVIGNAKPDSAPRLELMQVLYDLKWNPEPAGASGVWKELALSKVQHGQREAARPIIARITAPDDLVAVRSDKRFDGLFNQDEPGFNVEAAAVRRADLLRTYAQSHPKDLQPEARLDRALLAIGRFEEVVDRADRTLTRVKYGDGPFKHLSQKRWIMDSRAWALAAMGRVPEALTQLEDAAKPDDKGESDANRVLNLGAFYCTLGRADDALATVQRATDLSKFGKGVQAYVRHCAALVKHDSVQAERELDFLREHKQDNERPLLRALLRGNHMDEAAKSVIDRLAAVDSRNPMLVQLQDYLEPRTLPGGEVMNARWEAMMARDDVKRAVERVGRIEHYDYYGD